MITRVDGEDWIVLQSEDNGYGVEPGTTFRWADSFCSHMVKGQTPKIAAQSDLVPEYRSAPIGQQVDIGAYIGQPLLGEDGSLFGTLCAIDPDVQPESIVEEEELVALIGSLLSGILQSELKVSAWARHLERQQLAARADSQTGLCDLQGWNRALYYEEGRCSLFGHPAAVLAVRIEGINEGHDPVRQRHSDTFVHGCTSVLLRTLRSIDIAAHLGGGVFAGLLVECSRVEAAAISTRLSQAMREAGIDVSVALVSRNPTTGLEAAWQEALQQLSTPQT